MELESKDVSPAIRLLVRYDFVFAMFFAVGSLFFMFRIESTFNGGLAYAAKVLAVPVALAVFGFTYFNRRYLASLHPGKPWLPWFNSTLIYPLCILFGWPWLMAVNTLTFENHEMEFKGVVTRKFTSGKGHLYEIRIQDISSNEPIELNVSQATYNDLVVGAEYKECFLRGLLGIPYRWQDSPQIATCGAARSNGMNK